MQQVIYVVNRFVLVLGLEMKAVVKVYIILLQVNIFILMEMIIGTLQEEPRQMVLDSETSTPVLCVELSPSFGVKSHEPWFLQ